MRDLNKIKKTINDIIYAKNNWNYICKIYNREKAKLLNSKRSSEKKNAIKKGQIKMPPVIYRFLKKLKHKNKIREQNWHLKNRSSLYNKNINILRNKFNQMETIGDSKNNLFITSLKINKKYEYYKNILEFNDYELNEMSYKNAIKHDKRTYFRYYFSLIRQKHLLIFSFFPMRDYNFKSVKIDSFFIKFAINIAVNALFFNDGTIHKIYEEAGYFNFLYQLPQIIYSSLISGLINSILDILSLTGENIIKIKHLKDGVGKKSNKILKIIENKVSFYFILSYILLIFFWYYIGCFCAIYRNTQFHLIKDNIISFGTSFISPFFINLLPGIFRIPSLKNNKMENMYKFSRILQALI